MLVLKGKGVCGTAAVGKVTVFGRREGQRPALRERAEDSEAEKRRFAAAKALAAEQLSALREKALREAGEKAAQIFEIHAMLLEDEDYNESVKSVIEGQRAGAEYAVSVTGERFAENFAAMDDEYMRARAADIRDISRRVIDCLSPSDAPAPLPDEKTVICADDLSPSETVSLDREKILALVTARGSANSHTAILARSMGIPAVIGVGEKLMESVSDGMTAAVNGESGEVFLSPDSETLAALESGRERLTEEKRRLEALRGKDNVTLDGRRVNVYANVGSVSAVKEALNADAGGIGLFRSEFLYLERNDLPTEEEQLSAYRKALEEMAGKRVIIRTLDIGADKRAEHFRLEKEENPALGMRAVRLCLDRPEIFRTQLRALYRASVYGNLGIMFPMIASVFEVEEILSLCGEVRAELKAEGKPVPDSVELGIMIETPAAAVISDLLAPLVDFFSVGTNDLTQYTLACDRQNPKLERFCDPHHEAVLRLIALAAENAHKNGAWIGICGELAADTALTERFLRMGIDELSVSPPYVLRLRERIREIDLKK